MIIKHRYKITQGLILKNELKKLLPYFLKKTIRFTYIVLLILVLKVAVVQTYKSMVRAKFDVYKECSKEYNRYLDEYDESYGFHDFYDNW